MTTFIRNNIKYIECCDNPNLKNSGLLEDKLYFTFRDIFMNTSEIYNMMFLVNEVNFLLTNNISYSERDENFRYTEYLHNIDNLNYVISLVEKIDVSYFDFYDDMEDEYIDWNNVVSFDNWFQDLKDLLRKLKEYRRKM